MITLDKPLSAYTIRVLFKCEESDQSRSNTTIFSVESAIWGKSRETGNNNNKGPSYILIIITILRRSNTGIV